jgi:ectoine hydroxylase-related dioxygenase (phytanoyl-CoA dioxygenase family)
MKFDPDGAQLFPAAFAPSQLDALAAILAAMPADRPGARLRPIPGLAQAVQPATSLASAIIGSKARPVCATLFDKSGESNWSLGWHQDRTIAVRNRVETPGFTRWTTKGGIAHVVPPFEIVERMLTLRIHLDPVGPDNAPLLVVPGSHRFGRVTEREIAALVARLGPRACAAEAGDLWLYATPILHASARAARPTRRRVLQLLYSVATLPNGLEWLGV